MLRILRAFAWMRWRVFLNSLERTGARDRLERLSIAVEQIGPIVAVLLLVPSLLGLSAASAFAGFALADGAGVVVTFEVIRFATLAASILAVVGPIVIPVVERANPVRLLLLPIPRATLYFAQAAGALADPWTLLILPIVIFLPLGLAAGGALAAVPLALGAGLLFAGTLIGISTLVSSLVQIIVRDRRRGELVALAFILVVPLAGLITGALDQSLSSRHRSGDGTARSERQPPSVVARAARRGYTLLPSERYAAAIRASAQDGPTAPAAAGSALALALTALGIHGLGLAAFGQLLAAPGSVSRRGRETGRARATAVPGLSATASAVAMAQIRLALRTPRGRATLLAPLILLGVLAVVATRSGGAHMTLIPNGGVGLAALAAFIGLLGVLPLAANQFAIDGAGLTLELLSPISEGDLLAGKAVANFIIGGVPAIVCILATAVIFPRGPLALWLCLPLGVVSVYLLAAPIAALGSILFPRVVDLNSVGKGSNAHGVAGLMGIAAFAVAAVPPLLIVLFASTWMERPQLAPVMLLAWSLIAFGVCLLLFRPLRGLLARRRENLGLVAA
jgi:hypothetical protein